MHAESVRLRVLDAAQQRGIKIHNICDLELESQTTMRTSGLDSLPTFPSELSGEPNPIVVVSAKAVKLEKDIDTGDEACF